MNQFIVEENMKRTFIIRRQSLSHQMAEHRWDRPYQLLFLWSSKTEQEQFVPHSHQMEVEDESRDLCPSIDPTASLSPFFLGLSPFFLRPFSRFFEDTVSLSLRDDQTCQHFIQFPVSHKSSPLSLQLIRCIVRSYCGVLHLSSANNENCQDAGDGLNLAHESSRDSNPKPIRLEDTLTELAKHDLKRISVML